MSSSSLHMPEINKFIRAKRNLTASATEGFTALSQIQAQVGHSRRKREAQQREAERGPVKKGGKKRQPKGSLPSDYASRPHFSNACVLNKVEAKKLIAIPTRCPSPYHPQGSQLGLLREAKGSSLRKKHAPELWQRDDDGVPKTEVSRGVSDDASGSVKENSYLMNEKRDWNTSTNLYSSKNNDAYGALLKENVQRQRFESKMKRERFRQQYHENSLAAHRAPKLDWKDMQVDMDAVMDPGDQAIERPRPGVAFELCHEPQPPDPSPLSVNGADKEMSNQDNAETSDSPTLPAIIHPPSFDFGEDPSERMRKKQDEVDQFLMNLPPLNLHIT